GRKLRRRSGERSQSTRLPAASRAPPPMTPWAKARKTGRSRSGSRTLTMTAKPTPARTNRMGRISSSPAKRRERQAMWTAAKAARKRTDQSQSEDLNWPGVRTTTCGLSWRIWSRVRSGREISSALSLGPALRRAASSRSRQLSSRLSRSISEAGTRMRASSPTLRSGPWWARFQISSAAKDCSAELSRKSSSGRSCAEPRRSLRLISSPDASLAPASAISPVVARKTSTRLSRTTAAAPASSPASRLRTDPPGRSPRGPRPSTGKPLRRRSSAVERVTGKARPLPNPHPLTPSPAPSLPPSPGEGGKRGLIQTHACTAFFQAPSLPVWGGGRSRERGGWGSEGSPDPQLLQPGQDPLELVRGGRHVALGVGEIAGLAVEADRLGEVVAGGFEHLDLVVGATGVHGVG